MTTQEHARDVHTDAPDRGTAVLERNIRALRERRRQRQATATREERVAQAITGFTGSMRFVYLHLILFGAWIVLNLNWIPGVRPWDPSFVVLAMVASVEAIFLSTFILITQNRMTATQYEMDDLDLHVSLLAEHEITKLVSLVSALTDKMGVHTEVDAEIGELKADVAPEAVLDKIDTAEREKKT
jgi:uncharacterized membrane protein